MIRRVTLWILAAVSTAIPAFAAGEDIDAAIAQINRAIAQQGAAWRAGRTFLSDMPDADFKMMLGARPSPLLQRMTPLAPQGDRSLPAHFDWRDQNGKNYVTSVKNQGRCGSCTAFAAVGALEAGIRIRDNNPDLAVDLSEQEAFDCGGGTCEGGSEPAVVLQNMVDNGVVDEPCFPYLSGGTVDDYNCSHVCSDASSRTFHIASFHTIGKTTAMIKQALVDFGPLLATMNVYQDLKYYFDGVYQYTWGDLLGGHAVLIVGWDDDDRAWIIKNSWTASFGENGFFRIRWGNCGINAGVTAVAAGNDRFTPGAAPGGDCPQVATALYDQCHLAYDNGGKSLSKTDFQALCAGGGLPQGAFNCAQEHAGDCHLLAACEGFVGGQWCALDLSYVYQSCGLQIALEASQPLSLTDATGLCNAHWEYAPSFKCVFDCVAGSAACADLSTCLTQCPFCPFPTVHDFQADVTTSAGPPLTATFTRNVTIPPNCGAVGANWQFGDGGDNYSPDDVVQHTYTEPGEYTVSLTVLNGSGPGELVKSLYIHVGSADDDAVDDDASPDDDVSPEDDDNDAADDDASPSSAGSNTSGCGC